MKPIIGINLDVEAGPPEKAMIQAPYWTAIQRSGGIPVLLPPMNDEDLDQLLTKIAGIMFIGGDDYCPSNYGEAKHQSVELCHPSRDDFDIRLMKKTLNRDMPVLGVCAGAQLLNIAMGGTLIQDIGTEQENAETHTSKNGWQNGWTMHPVKIEPHTELAQIFRATEVSIVSSHHQAIRRLGSGLKAVAWAEDGIIEAVESESRPFTIGVQWHPERDYETNEVLFSEFVRRCAITCGAV
jgi:putative glutamine amidotransferase